MMIYAAWKGLLDPRLLRYDHSICTTLLYPLLMQRHVCAQGGNGIGASCWLETAMGRRSLVTGEGFLFGFRRLCYGTCGFIFRVYCK